MPASSKLRLDGNKAGWLHAVASLVMEGGDKPPSKLALVKRAPNLVGPTAISDGYGTAVANGEKRNTVRGQELCVDWCLHHLRAVGWVEGDDEALRWTGPLTGHMRLQVEGRSYLIMGEEETRAAKDEGKVAAVLAGRGHLNPVQHFAQKKKKGDPDRVAMAARTGRPVRRQLEIHPLALAIPQMTGPELDQLRDDVREHGIRQPIVLFEGKVLDGRHRVYMASEYDLPVHLEDFEGDETAARAYVFSMNLVRRHLTTAQRVLAAKVLFQSEAEREAAAASQQAREAAGRAKVGYRKSAVANNGSEAASRGKTAAQIVAEKAGGAVSARTIETMRDVDPVRTPETVAKIQRGEIQTAKAAAKAAAEELGQQVPEVPEDRTPNDLAGQVLGYAKRYAKARSGAAATPEEQAKIGEAINVLTATL